MQYCSSILQVTTEIIRKKFSINRLTQSFRHKQCAMSFPVAGKPSIIFPKTVSDCDNKEINFVFYILPSDTEYLCKFFAAKVRNHSL